MNPFYLLAGIVVAAGVFGATLFSLAQAVMQRGRLRWAHIALVVLGIAGMGTVSLIWPAAAVGVGAALIAAGAVAVWSEKRWSKLLPIFQAVFGLALVLGIPFA
ncbi:MAG: hypothetical protein AAFW69_04145 [Pseudomonadota bacterium]